MKCDLKKRLSSGETLPGTWVTISHSDIADVLEAVGLILGMREFLCSAGKSQRVEGPG